MEKTARYISLYVAAIGIYLCFVCKAIVAADLSIDKQSYKSGYRTKYRDNTEHVFIKGNKYKAANYDRHCYDKCEYLPPMSSSNVAFNNIAFKRNAMFALGLVCVNKDFECTRVHVFILPHLIGRRQNRAAHGSNNLRSIRCTTGFDYFIAHGILTCDSAASISLYIASISAQYALRSASCGVEEILYAGSEPVIFMTLANPSTKDGLTYKKSVITPLCTTNNNEQFKDTVLSNFLQYQKEGAA